MHTETHTHPVVMIGYLLISSIAFRDFDGISAGLPEEKFHDGFVVGAQCFKELAHNTSCKLTQLLNAIIKNN